MKRLSIILALLISADVSAQSIHPPAEGDIQKLIALGLVGGSGIAGHVTGQASATTANPTAMNGSTYTPQSTSQRRSLKSSSANDNASGTGAQTVTINYLNSSMVLEQDTVILNGTTAVNSNATDIQFIENMFVASTGTAIVNAGNISMYVTTNGSGSIWASINAGQNQTLYDHHYVPAGVSCFVFSATGGATLAAGASFLVHTGNPVTPGTLPTTQIGDIFLHQAGASFDHDYDVPLAVPGPDLIYAFEIPNAATANNMSYGSFDFVQF